MHPAAAAAGHAADAVGRRRAVRARRTCRAFAGYYLTGDGGYVDDDGYLYVMGRTDDVINVAGHRLSTGAMEAVLAAHPAVAECAVIGVADALKGQVPRGSGGAEGGGRRRPGRARAPSWSRVVRDQIGPVAALRRVDVVPALPKTRSGKILRRSLRAIADGGDEPVPSTIEDPAALEAARAVLRPPAPSDGPDTAGRETPWRIPYPFPDHGFRARAHARSRPRRSRRRAGRADLAASRPLRFRHGYAVGLAIAAAVAIVDMSYAGLGVAGAASLVQIDAIRLGLGDRGCAPSCRARSAHGLERLPGAASVAETDEEVGVTPAGVLSTALAATASDPLTIVSWAAVFAGASVAGAVDGAGETLTLIVGIGLGTLLWKSGLTGAVADGASQGAAIAGFASSMSCPDWGCWASVRCSGVRRRPMSVTRRGSGSQRGVSGRPGGRRRAARRDGRPVRASSASAAPIMRRPRLMPSQRSGSGSQRGERWPTQGSRTRSVSAPMIRSHSVRPARFVVPTPSPT